MHNLIKIKDNNIWIGEKLISFPSETTIVKLEEYNHVVCFNTWPKESDLNWKNLDTKKIWQERCLKNPSKLFCYEYSGALKWEFPFDKVVGIEKETPKTMSKENFASTELYENYINKFADKELIIIYADNYRYRVNVNSGEIYDKVISM